MILRDNSIFNDKDCNNIGIDKGQQGNVAIGDIVGNDKGKEENDDAEDDDLENVIVADGICNVEDNDDLDDDDEDFDLN